MAYNAYANPYNYNYYGTNYQPNMAQNQMAMPQQMQNQYDMQIQGVLFLTSDEAKAYIVPPNKRVMIMDVDKSVFYIKSADALGQSSTTPYKFEPLNNEQSKVEIDATPSFATLDDLQKLKSDIDATIEELKKGLIKQGE